MGDDRKMKLDFGGEGEWEEGLMNLHLLCNKISGFPYSHDWRDFDQSASLEVVGVRQNDGKK